MVLEIWKLLWRHPVRSWLCKIWAWLQYSWPVEIPCVKCGKILLQPKGLLYETVHVHPEAKIRFIKACVCTPIGSFPFFNHSSHGNVRTRICFISRPLHAHFNRWWSMQSTSWMLNANAAGRLSSWTLRWIMAETEKKKTLVIRCCGTYGWVGWAINSATAMERITFIQDLKVIKRIASHHQSMFATGEDVCVHVAGDKNSRNNYWSSVRHGHHGVSSALCSGSLQRFLFKDKGVHNLAAWNI